MSPAHTHMRPRRYDLILATDPFVRDETVHAFVHAARSLASPTSVIAIAFQVRDLRVWEGLLAALSDAGFELREVSARRQARSAMLSGFSGTWCPIVLARLKPRARRWAWCVGRWSFFTTSSNTYSYGHHHAVDRQGAATSRGTTRSAVQLSEHEVRLASAAAEPHFYSSHTR